MKRTLLVVIAISIVVPFTAHSKTGRANDEATIYRDEYGIPHVFAQTLEGASFAIGYAQAEDRLEELLKNYRRANGTMSEVFGPDNLAEDLQQRLFHHGEIARAKRYFPHVKEYFFDDDTFTDDLPRAEAIARGLGKVGVTWSCNAKANVPSETLRVLRDNGLRLLLVGYESGSQTILNNIKKGIRVDVARRFTRDAHALGIVIHGTFIVGLPGETRATIEDTIRYACEIDPDTIQVSIAAPYPGTALYREAVDGGWLRGPDLVSGRGFQQSALSYPHLSSAQIFEAVEAFYTRFYFRPRKLWAITREMARDRRLLGRRLREGVEFFRFLAQRGR